MRLPGRGARASAMPAQAHMLKRLEADKKGGVPLPEKEARVFTSFIRSCHPPPH